MISALEPELALRQAIKAKQVITYTSSDGPRSSLSSAAHLVIPLYTFAKLHKIDTRERAEYWFRECYSKEKVVVWLKGKGSESDMILRAAATRNAIIRPEGLIHPPEVFYVTGKKQWDFLDTDDLLKAHQTESKKLNVCGILTKAIGFPQKSAQFDDLLLFRPAVDTLEGLETKIRGHHERISPYMQKAVFVQKRAGRKFGLHSNSCQERLLRFMLGIARILVSGFGKVILYAVS
ncbi:uncharacterized protein EV420DRAFT_1481510 [Desarmillaria tabescens]|uniref:Uncharacterized protein n=1 Tax=Armillaria tabescens TaxID=1929756 RepID=A0AA39K649_ARMTA|nr:uncharacterized protein EV420DRAFT_1481510 [Desarmillaria tabescens]KAK0455272.1 hypothetical protein EV420DRAFT_1481510 [Desarmillaria tabescens]